MPWRTFLGPQTELSVPAQCLSSAYDGTSLYIVSRNEESNYSLYRLFPDRAELVTTVSAPARDVEVVAIDYENRCFGLQEVEYCRCEVDSHRMDEDCSCQPQEHWTWYNFEGQACSGPEPKIETPNLRALASVLGDSVISDKLWRCGQFTVVTVERSKYDHSVEAVFKNGVLHALFAVESRRSLVYISEATVVYDDYEHVHSYGYQSTTERVLGQSDLRRQSRRNIPFPCTQTETFDGTVFIDQAGRRPRLLLFRD